MTLQERCVPSASMTGNTQLSKWRTKKRLTIYAAAKLLKADWGAYRDWENGSKRPSLDSAVTIERVTGIPVDAWARSRDAAT